MEAAAGARRKSSRPKTTTGIRPAEFIAAVTQALEVVDADERVGPLIRATGLRMRFEITDLGLTLSVAAGERRGEHLRWAWSDEVEWEPRLRLSMRSEVANRYLQGLESLAIAIARGEVRVEGESRTALLYLPATRLICGAYRKLVESSYPGLAITA